MGFDGGFRNTLKSFKNAALPGSLTNSLALTVKYTVQMIINKIGSIELLKLWFLELDRPVESLAPSVTVILTKVLPCYKVKIKYIYS